jgi:hypothetical protein
MDQKNKTLEGSLLAHIYKSSSAHEENKKITVKNNLADNTFFAFEKSINPKTIAKTIEIPWE